MANQKLTELSEDATPLDTDLTYGVKDPAGSPSSIKWTWSTLKTFLKTYFDTLYNIFINTPPTDLKISTASKGGVLRNIDGAVGDTPITSAGWLEGNEALGWWMSASGGGVLAQFNTTIIPGEKVLEVSTTDTSSRLYVENGSGGPNGFKNCPSLKPSTTYKFTCEVKTINAVANSVRVQLNSLTSAGANISSAYTPFSSVDSDFTPLTITFTTPASAAFMRIVFLNYTAGNVSKVYARIQKMTLEEVKTDTTFLGKVAEKTRGSYQAVTSTDNIDQSLDPTGAYANTYALTNAVNEGATHIQTFTPTKKKVYSIKVWCVATGTGVDWALLIHDSSNNVVGLSSITAANLVTGWNEFTFGNLNWVSGALHFHLYASATTGTPTCKANTSNDLETASYIQYYDKLSEGGTIGCNGIKTELKGDKDGLLTNSIIDLDNSKYRYSSRGSGSNGGGSVAQVADVFSMTTDARGFYKVGNIGTDDSYHATGSVVYKINTILPIKHLLLSFSGLENTNGATVTFAISKDNITYTNLYNKTTATGVVDYRTLATELKFETDLLNGGSVFYLKWTNSTGDNRFYSFGVRADLDTSSIPQGLFYPLGVNQFAETWKAADTVRSYVYRQAKYTNENGVVMPAIEFNTGSGGAGLTVGYIPLKIDNSQETTPAITILASSGVASDTVLNTDGAYVALSSGATEGSINYQVTITKNTLYLSSNAESVDSTQDPSHQGNFIVGVRQQGLTDRVKDIGEETEDIKKGLADTKQLIRNNSLILAYDAGTTDAYEVTIADFEGYKAGLALIFKANTANTDGATLNVNGMGAKAIVKGVSTALSTNDILASMYCHCVFDGTNFVLLNPRA